MAADAVAEAVLAPRPVALLPKAADVAEPVVAPTPLAVLPMAADAVETALAQMPVAAPPVATDDDAEVVVAPPPPIADDAEAVLVPIPVADPPSMTADAAAPTPVAPASPPEKTAPSVTPAEEEVPWQADVDKVHEFINALLFPTHQKSCGMVTNMKENETSHCPPENDDGESNHAAIRKQPEETVHPSDHSVPSNQQPMAASDDEDVQNSGTQQPLPCPSDQQQNHMLGCERNDESQDVSRAESIEKLTPLEMTNMMVSRRGLVDPRLAMRNRWNGEDLYYMGSRFLNNRDIGDLDSHSLLKVSNDQCGHSDNRDHIHGDACRLDHRFDHHDAHYPNSLGRGRRIGCPCRHCNDQRYHGNIGHQWLPDFQYPMVIDDISDPSLSNESGHIDDDDDDDDDDDNTSHFGIFNHRYHHQIFQGRAKRSECPSHFNDQRNNRNCGYPCQHGFKLCNPMDIARERWSPPKPDHEHMSPWFSPKPDPVGAALFNPQGWTCFLNCILQCMVHTVPLVLKLQEADHPDPCPRRSIGFCCYCSLKQQANESIKHSGSAVYPMNFVDSLSSISPDFERGVQQDAQELLRCLLDKLDESSIAPGSSEEPPSTEVGIAKKVFGGRLKSQLHCPECNHCSDRYEPFLDLSLEVNMVETLVDALESFTKVEVIEAVMCDGCKSRVNMEKHLKVEQAPEVLVIHLKRFLNCGYNIFKIWDKVKYALELDIAPFMCSVEDAPQKYDLYGVVEHLGLYAKGHYLCYIRSSQADWYKFDDNIVHRCFEEMILDNTAYLLFYVKQGSSPWFSSLLEKENKIPPDGPAERGPGELTNNKEESTSSDRQNVSSSLGGSAEDRNGLSSLVSAKKTGADNKRRNAQSADDEFKASRRQESKKQRAVARPLQCRRRPWFSVKSKRRQR